MNKPVCILGSGPAGLLAAHAVALAGQPIVIASLPHKSRIGGAQFLHEGIPELTSPHPDTVITYDVRGTAETYEKKVYGDNRPAFVSFSNVFDGHKQAAWNLPDIYDKLWDAFGNSLTHVEVTPEWLDKTQGDFSMVVSSVPAPALCRSHAGLIPEQHTFDSIDVTLFDECLEPVPEGHILYEGSPDRSWYRSANLFGVESTEWGGKPNLPFPGTFTVTKPLRTTCNCYPDIIRVGRYGTWTKGVLVNDAFRKTIIALHSAGLLTLAKPL
jgi:hypothetical protein